MILGLSVVLADFWEPWEDLRCSSGRGRLLYALIIDALLLCQS